MKIGFTGTQKGMTVKQKEALVEVLDDEMKKEYISEFHHGDCIGADAQAHELFELCTEDGLIVIHPPSNPTLRAWCKGTKRKHKPYIMRNHDIVDETDVLIAAPKEEKEQLRSGTWATIRYAKKKKKNVLIILPNGDVIV